MPSPLKPATIIEAVLRWLHTPWVHQGRDRTGLDCIGLLTVLSDELDVPVLDSKDYARWPDGVELMRWLRKTPAITEVIPMSAYREGDLVVFWIRRPGYPQHTGIVGQRGRTLIHTHSGAGKVVQEPFSKFWIKRIAGTFRITG